MTAAVVILADADWVTCPGCRSCVPMGRVCRCPSRTKGPSVEPVLTRIVNGRRRVIRQHGSG